MTRARGARVVAALAVLVWIPLSAQSPQEARAFRPADVDVRPKILEKRLPFGDPPPALYGAPFVVEFELETDGSFHAARVLSPPSGPHPFRDEYLQLLRQWKFEPGRKDGIPVRVALTLRVEVEPSTRPQRGGPPLPSMKATWIIEGADDDFGLGAVPFRSPGLTMPRVLRDRRPSYPSELLRERINGMVEVEAIISVDGKVAAARVVRSTDRRFNAEGLKAAREWTFVPGQVAGAPVPVLITIVLEFRQK